MKKVDFFSDSIYCHNLMKSEKCTNPERKGGGGGLWEEGGCFRLPREKDFGLIFCLRRIATILIIKVSFKGCLKEIIKTLLCFRALLCLRAQTNLI